MPPFFTASCRLILVRPSRYTMTSIVRLLTGLGKALVFIFAVGLPVIGAWGLFFIVFYHAKFWLVGSFWYIGIGAAVWLLLCWRSPEPRRTFGMLALHTTAYITFAVSGTLFRIITERPKPPATRDVIFLVASAVGLAVTWSIVVRAAKRQLRAPKGSNPSLKSTIGPCDNQT
jgi:hypothetical protein